MAQREWWSPALVSVNESQHLWPSAVTIQSNAIEDWGLQYKISGQFGHVLFLLQDKVKAVAEKNWTAKEGQWTNNADDQREYFAGGSLFELKDSG